MKTVCFTGHRPQAVGEYQVWIESQLRHIINRALQKGVDWFISGGALGVDQWAAYQVIQARNTAVLRLTIARPFPSQAQRWTIKQQHDYFALCIRADGVIDVNPDPFANWKYHARDKWMVEKADAVIAVWNGQEKGGTAATVRLARKAGKPLYWINPIEKTALWYNNQ